MFAEVLRKCGSPVDLLSSCSGALSRSHIIKTGLRLSSPQSECSPDECVGRRWVESGPPGLRIANGGHPRSAPSTVSGTAHRVT